MEDIKEDDNHDDELAELDDALDGPEVPDHPEAGLEDIPTEAVDA